MGDVHNVVYSQQCECSLGIVITIYHRCNNFGKN